MPENLEQQPSLGGAQTAPEPSVPSSNPQTISGGEAPPSQQQAQAEWVSILDHAKARGQDLSRYQTDEQALNAMLQIHQRYPQMEQLAQYGNEWLQFQNSKEYNQYQQWLRQNQPQQQAQPGWWNPPLKQPEYEQAVNRWMTQDPVSGQRVPKPGAPASIVSKINEYEGYTQDWANKFVHNPQDALKDPVREMAQAVIREEFQRQQVHNASMDVVKRHENWLFHRDPQTGVPLYNQYTPQGIAFWNAVKEGERMGITDPYNLEYFALTKLTAQSQQFQQPQQAPQQQPPKNQAPSAARIGQHAQPAQPKAMPRGNVSLEQQLRENLVASGFNDISLLN